MRTQKKKIILSQFRCHPQMFLCINLAVSNFNSISQKAKRFPKISKPAALQACDRYFLPDK